MVTETMSELDKSVARLLWRYSYRLFECGWILPQEERWFEANTTFMANILSVNAEDMRDFIHHEFPFDYATLREKE